MADRRPPQTGSPNYGIQIAGGTLNANAVAAGPHARAHSEGPGPSLADDFALLADLRRQMDDLLAEVRLHVNVDGDGDTAEPLAALREGEAELAKERPQRSVVVDALTRAAAGIAPLGAAAESFRSILHLLGLR